MKSFMYAPMLSMKKFAMSNEGPIIKASIISSIASRMLVLDSILTPLFIPEIADVRNSIVAIAMIIIWTFIVCIIPNR